VLVVELVVVEVAVEETVVEVVEVVEVVLAVGQGFGEQVPAPSFIPPSAVHCAALSTTQAKAPIGDD
jgi:hypothetical protein